MRHIWLTGVVTLACVVPGACARRPVQASAPELPIRDQPDGWACVTERLLSEAPADLYARARAALTAMRVEPAVQDSASGRLTVAGARAPESWGGPAVRGARLYLDFRAAPVPGQPGVTAYRLAPGVYMEPRGLAPVIRESLYEQADSLGREFTTRARLPNSSCFEKR